jgi:hypothetical protein
VFIISTAQEFVAATRNDGDIDSIEFIWRSETIFIALDHMEWQARLKNNLEFIVPTTIGLLWRMERKGEC